MALKLQHELKQQLSSLSDSLGGNLPLDGAVLKALPSGTTSALAHSYGHSAWSFTAKINALDQNHKPVAYLLKYVAGDIGRHQLKGEFIGMAELHRLAPEMVPRPIAQGKLEVASPATYFLLIEFKNFIPGLPDAAKLGARLAALHERSESPDGKFGFHVQTYDGARLQAIAPDSSWTSFFSKLLAEAYRQDAETNGVWPELALVHSRVQSHLIPRLIGVLESEGRTVKPTLIHGDLWEGNIGVDADTGDPWIFDCAAYYAHNEMELGIWRAQRHQMNAERFRLEYRKHFRESEPADEWDDRIILYSAKTNFMHSACCKGSTARESRKSAFESMLLLVRKYVPADDSLNDC
ncbi:hypothetical protein JX265_002587 [Neoarthrinium moseri]|uniref:protein-ribulosamine 3-kinase n=1 Tax=Neoarthrinium moseri TaxID=1658444 RepID=A0A9P9WUP5_9PEZI|nr:hypothetical protein JX265_002587 [Neoarthrinium moseri]